jgi:hypothetical protein
MTTTKNTPSTRLLAFQQPIAQIAAVAIVAAAIVLTFSGTVEFCERHGAAGWRGVSTAAITDVTVLIGILWPRRPLQGLAALAAIFTMLANLGHASPGLSGVAVALIPPVGAILMVGALEYVIKHPLDVPDTNVEITTTVIFDEGAQQEAERLRLLVEQMRAEIDALQVQPEQPEVEASRPKAISPRRGGQDPLRDVWDANGRTWDLARVQKELTAAGRNGELRPAREVLRRWNKWAEAQNGAK